MAVSMAAMAQINEDMREGSAHETAAAAVPRSMWMLLRKGLRERHALRLLQASQVATNPRWAVESCSTTDRVQLAQLRRASLARRRAAAAAAHSSAAIAKLSAPQEESSAATTMQAQLPSPAIAAAAFGAASAAAVSACAPARTIMPECMGGGNDVAPERYLLDLLHSRGRSTKIISSAQAGYRQKPTAKQISDYDDSRPFLSNLVRGCDVDGLREAVKAGRGMDASNKFGESVVHVACRRGSMDVLRFLLDNGGSLTCCDDLGRFPLHEVCWAVEPRFDIVRLYLNDDRGSAAAVASVGSAEERAAAGGSGGGGGDLLISLLVADKRGFTPLRYVKEASWPIWRQFLDEVVDEFWPSLVAS